MKNILTTLLIIMTTTIAKDLSSQVREIPVRDFFRNPEKTSYQISPDGNYLSYLAPYENRLNIFVENLSTGEINRSTESLNRDIYGYAWKGNNRLIYIQDEGGDENYKLFATDPDGTDLKVLTPFENVMTQIVDVLEEDDNHLLISLNNRNPQVFDVYRINVFTGEMNLVAENPGNIVSWTTDHDGKLRLAITTDGVNTTTLYRDSEEEPFQPILTASFKEVLSPLFFTFDNKNYYAASNLGRDKLTIVEYDPKESKEVQIIFEHPDVDVSSLGFSKKRKVLTRVSYTTWKRQMEFLDEITRQRYERLQSELGEEKEIVLIDNNKDEDVFLVRTYSDKSLGAHYIFDTKKDEIKKLSDVSPWLDENEMAEMKPIQYTTRDGMTIHGYLTLPKDVPAENLPVVVNPHGGPWARDTWGFNPEVQFLANRGFAVLQVNFRGSTGFGKEFWQSSFKQWGLKMQDDITDGVLWLIDEGIADHKRIGIYGGSYGGYATLAGLTFTPDLYAAGVDYVGVSNLFTFLETIPPYWEPFKEMMYEMVGNPKSDSIQFVATSPVFHADKIIAPLFIAQGKNDPRVKISESDQMVEAMRKRGIEVEYMVKDNEGHGFSNEENKFDFYEAMEKFLKRHLKPAM